MLSNVVDVSGKDQFDSYVSSSDNEGKLIFADFWASWCGPCRMLGPILHELAEKYPNKVFVMKIDVDNPTNQELAMSYSVRSIPQVTLFKDGKKIDQFVGVLPLERIEEFLTKYT